MTRAHFAQAVVKLSMQQHTGQTHMVFDPLIAPLRVQWLRSDRFLFPMTWYGQLCAAVHSLFEQSVDPFWQAASSKYFFYTCTDPTFKKMVRPSH